MPKTFVHVHFATLSPETYRKHLCIAKSPTHIIRKRRTKSAIEVLLGEDLPRHDSADAIAVGIAAIDRKFTLRASFTWKRDTHQSWYDALFAPPPVPLTSDDQSLSACPSSQDLPQTTPVDQKKEPIKDDEDDPCEPDPFHGNTGPDSPDCAKLIEEEDGTIFGGGGCSSGDY